MNQPQGGSIWGNINTCIEIALNIYMITALDENGKEHKGIFAHKDNVGKNLSASAAANAEQDGEWLCFDESKQYIPLYEVLQQRIAMCRNIELSTMKLMEQIKHNSDLTLTDFYGSYEPPTQIEEDSFEKICNGIYFTNNGETKFAVHNAIVKNYMTPLAAQFGCELGEYIFYDLHACAVPLLELKDIFEEINQLIISEDSLYATLNQNFSDYVANYNNIMPEKIPELEGAPANLFLSTQLLEEMRQSEVNQYNQDQDDEIEPDFDEVTDYEIGS